LSLFNYKGQLAQKKPTKVARGYQIAQRIGFSFEIDGELQFECRHTLHL